MTQELLSIDKDCDSDALRFTVVQKGYLTKNSLKY